MDVGKMIYLALTDSPMVKAGTFGEYRENPDSITYTSKEEMYYSLFEDLNNLTEYRNDIPIIRFEKLLCRRDYLKLVKKNKYRYITMHINKTALPDKTIVGTILNIYGHNPETKSTYNEILTGINIEEFLELIVLKIMQEYKINKLDTLYIDFPITEDIWIPAEKKIYYSYSEDINKPTKGGQLLELALTTQNPKVLEGLVNL